MSSYIINTGRGYKPRLQVINGAQPRLQEKKLSTGLQTPPAEGLRKYYYEKRESSW